MCHPAIVVGLVTSAISTGLSIASANRAANDAANAQERSNRIATQQAIGRRGFESAQLQAEKNQLSKKLQVDRAKKSVEGIAARGRLQVGLADSGIGGGLTNSLMRSMNLDESTQLGLLDVSTRHMGESQYLKEMGSIMKASNEIQRLPLVPSRDTGLQIAGAVVDGVGTFVSTSRSVGKAFDDDWTFSKAFE